MKPNLPERTASQSTPPGKKIPAPLPPAAPVETNSPEDVETLVRLWTRFERFSWDVAGILLVSVSVMTLVAMIWPGLGGGILDWWVGLLLAWFGMGSVWLVSAGMVVGLQMLRWQHLKTPQHIAWGRILALEGAAFASLALLSVLGGISLQRAEQGLDGGRVGWGLAELLRLLLSPLMLGSPFWLTIFLVAVFVVMLSIGLFGGLGAGRRDGSLRSSFTGQSGASAGSGQDPASFVGSPVVSEAPIQEQAAVQVGSRKKRPALPAQFRKNFRVHTENDEVPAVPQPRDERLPPYDLLALEQSSRPDERNINLTAGLIEKTLSEFGIPARVTGFRIGPTVTQFAVEPGFVEKEKLGSEGDVNRQKVRVAQISALGRDLAMALAAERLRIEAPVPGRPYVGIEVPNTRSTVVRLRPVLESEAFARVSSPLAIALGRDVSGQAVVADLTRMPHLLIAGTTGSGKSVCIAALTTCLAMNNTPEDLRLVMIDPKMVELVRFNGLPHLLGKVETELERILVVLRWTVAEMDRRYKLLEASRSRNLDTYNRKARRRKGEEPLPRIVVMIDELADLMMSAPDQTEHTLVRLAQMARATGIHLVVATQRPSTDVVTGLIKANFPARISFAVASSIDSRVILDGVGAESLLGRGDMLFLQPEAAAPVRTQGAMVTDQEIERVINFWRNALPESIQQPSPWEKMLEEESVLADRDKLVEQAIRIVREEQHASASMLQRRLRIGYPRAARLIDELEELGVIGPSQGGGREREVLVGPDDGED